VADVCATTSLPDSIGSSRIQNAARYDDYDEAEAVLPDALMTETLGEDQMEALAFYSEQGFSINKALYQGDEVSDVVAMRMAQIDEAVKRGTFEEDTVLWRSLAVDTPQSPGSVIQADGYTSTTPILGDAQIYSDENFHGTGGQLVQIIAPAGTNAQWVSYDWAEVLLPRGSRFRVIREGLWEVIP